MPSGPSHWHDFWGDDKKPSDYLSSRGFRFTRGGFILPPEDGRKPDVLDRAAISYLCMEWDHEYKENTSE